VVPRFFENLWTPFISTYKTDPRSLRRAQFSLAGGPRPNNKTCKLVFVYVKPENLNFHQYASILFLYSDVYSVLTRMHEAARDL